MDSSKYLESIEKLSGDQNRRESRLLAELLGEAGYADLEAYEASLSEQQSRLLFAIQAEIEDTEMALRQSEQLTQKLKKQLDKLKSLQKVLSK